MKDNEIVFSGLSSTYSHKPGDGVLHPRLIEEMKEFKPDVIYLHENKIRDAIRKIVYGDWGRLFIKRPKLPKMPKYTNHHLSHAATGLYTSTFKDAIIIAADAIGELESLVIYKAQNGVIDPQPLHVLKYPHSLGLFYSYHTTRIGFEPCMQERSLMEYSQRSSAKSDPSVLDTASWGSLYFFTTKNLHLRPSIIDDWDNMELKTSIAATTQYVLEDYMIKLVNTFTAGNKNVVFCGGVAYNSVLCKKLKEHCNLWVSPSPGDAGSALGAILQKTKQYVTLPNGKLF